MFGGWVHGFEARKSGQISNIILSIMDLNLVPNESSSLDG